ncbi:MAG TPA: hypothetical protein VGP96_15165 [Candidatus Dormibacteraeota bacterium]|nr:hypothetical protein [Candidatus Dormibacteraeota bacterium]
MTFECADCGCIVDRGLLVASCGDSECCCGELPHSEPPAAPDAARVEGSTPTPRRPRRRGRYAAATLAILTLVILSGAIGLYLRSAPAVSLRVPAGWRMVGDPAGLRPRVHVGQISLAGPFGATFWIGWEREAVGSGCLGGCENVPELHPLATRLDGLPVTLRPFPQPYHRLILQPIKDDVAGQTLYFGVSCRPPLPSYEKVCADILSSVEVGPPLLQRLRLNRVIVPVS